MESLGLPKIKQKKTLAKLAAVGAIIRHFRSLDADEDGMISAIEIKPLCAQLGLDTSRESLAAIIQDMETSQGNNDQEVSFSEFMRWYDALPYLPAVSLLLGVPLANCALRAARTRPDVCRRTLWSILCVHCLIYYKYTAGCPTESLRAELGVSETATA